MEKKLRNPARGRRADAMRQFPSDQLDSAKFSTQYSIMMSNRGWLQPSSCPWLDRFSTVSGDMPDIGRILISPLTQYQ
jgi:hypothetical protein